MAHYFSNQRLKRREPQSGIKLRDWVKITKPGIVVSNTLMAVIGAMAALPGAPVLLYVKVAVGTGGLIAGCGALNMVLERKTDGRMPRTSGRPIAAGRVEAETATMFGVALIIAGAGVLSSTTAAAVLLGLLATFVYLALYTPMKRSTWWAVPVGAVAGALPPVIGWVATEEPIGVLPVLLFAVLFVWQLPHFIAIGIRRWRDYERAGLQLGIRPNARTSAVLGARLSGLLLVALTAALGQTLDAGALYWVFALLGSGMFFGCTLRRVVVATDWAKRVFIASLLYLLLFTMAMYLAGL